MKKLSAPHGLSEPSKDVEMVFKLRAKLSQPQCRQISVNWDGQVPFVDSVEVGGAAESFGICPGDIIYSLNGVVTTGKGREELMSWLRGRPPQRLDLFLQFQNTWSLTIELHRKAAKSYIELCVTLHLNNPGESGLEIIWDGPLPRVAGVKESSPAWSAGLFVGDRIFQANSHFSSASLRRTLEAALEPRPPWELQQGAPLVLMIWRWPDAKSIAAEGASEASTAFDSDRLTPDYAYQDKVLAAAQRNASAAQMAFHPPRSAVATPVTRSDPLPPPTWASNGKSWASPLHPSQVPPTGTRNSLLVSPSTPRSNKQSGEPGSISKVGNQTREELHTSPAQPFPGDSLPNEWKPYLPSFGGLHSRTP